MNKYSDIKKRIQKIHKYNVDFRDQELYGILDYILEDKELKSELEKTSTISNAKKSFEEHDKFTEKERDNLLKILNTYVDKIEKKTWTTHDFI